jgi:hypothetical protein
MDMFLLHIPDIFMAPSKISSAESSYLSDGGLTRISHQLSTAAADPGMSTALRSVGLLDILLSMPAGPQKLTYLHLARSAKHHARLRRLATKSGEKCGLASLIALPAIAASALVDR